MRPSMASASSSSCASGTTRDTNPIANASAAEIISPVSMSSAALAKPTARGSAQAPPSPGPSPSLMKLEAKLALSPSLHTSEEQASTQPTPIANPVTAAQLHQKNLTSGKQGYVRVT